MQIPCKMGRNRNAPLEMCYFKIKMWLETVWNCVNVDNCGSVLRNSHCSLEGWAFSAAGFPAQGSLLHMAVAFEAKGVFQYLFLLLCFLHKPFFLHRSVVPIWLALLCLIGCRRGVSYGCPWAGKALQQAWQGLRCRACHSLSSELLFSHPALQESSAFSKLEGIPLESVWLD